MIYIGMQCFNLSWTILNSKRARIYMYAYNRIVLKKFI